MLYGQPLPFSLTLYARSGFELQVVRDSHCSFFYIWLYREVTWNKQRTKIQFCVPTTLMQFDWLSSVLDWLTVYALVVHRGRKNLTQIQFTSHSLTTKSGHLGLIKLAYPSRSHPALSDKMLRHILPLLFSFIHL